MKINRQKEGAFTDPDDSELQNCKFFQDADCRIHKFSPDPQLIEGSTVFCQIRFAKYENLLLDQNHLLFTSDPDPYLSKFARFAHSL
jgi:hypothetical protein